MTPMMPQSRYTRFSRLFRLPLMLAAAAFCIFFIFSVSPVRADMTKDSPVKFPEKGPLPTKFPPDASAKNREVPEKDYSIFPTPERSLEQLAKIEAALPPGKFTPPRADWTHLPRTRSILTEGGDLHVMAIGDSIVADTMRSAWLARLAQAYPKARIRGTVYVRGGGGCQHYKLENRIANNVIPRRPDLVFLGGISQQDVDSIREVIHQLRAGLPQVEILLATGAFGSTADPRVPSELAKARHSGSSPYGAALRKLAADEHCAFLDMTASWAEYIVSSGLHPHVFYRDAVHANEIGEQILSKILMAFFAPAVIPEISRSADSIVSDWPQWCGTDGKNMVSFETNIPSTFHPGDKSPKGGLDLATARDVRWATHVGSYTCVAPAVVGDRLFIGSVQKGKGILRCLNVATGRQIWQWIAPPRDVPKRVDGRAFQFSNFPRMLGLLSTPAVEDGRLYIVSHRLEVLCLDAKGAPQSTSTQTLDPEQADTSRVLWRYDVWDQLGVRPSDVCNCSVLIHGDFLYVCTSNGVDRDATASTHDEFRKVPAPDAPSFIVLEKKTGRLVATDDARIGSGGRLLHGQWSSPSLGRVGDKTLIFFGGGDGILYAFEALDKSPAAPIKLKPAWRFDCVPLEYQQAGKSEGRDPILQYCLGDRRRSDALNKKSDGSYMSLCEIIATPVFHDGKVYVAIGRDPDHGRGRGALWCIDPKGKGDITNTNKVWCYQGLDRTISTVSIHDGRLYIADVAGRLHCLEPATGRVLWVYETNAQVWGSTLVADGKVYMPTHKGLWIFAEASTPKHLNHIDLGAPMLVSPVIAHGTLYIASKFNLWAVGK